MSGVDISIRLDNLGAVREVLARLSGPQAREAYAAALNDAGFEARREMQKEFGRVFDRVTPYILKSSFVEKATPERLKVRIAPENQRMSSGVDPQKILQAQEFGGRRADKRSEIALRRAGILPNGYITAIPARPFPGSDDGRGNLRGPFVAQLISYFGASPEQGYRANLTDRRRRTIHRGTARTAGRRYFIAYGRMRDGRGAHLAAGIWSAQGTGGVDIQPVVMFVRQGRYTPRLSMDRIAQASDLQSYLDKRLRYRIRQVAGE